MKAYDCIIIGSGAIGWAAQYYLAKRGLISLTFEQFTLGHTKGSTHGQTRAFRLGYYDQEKYIPWLLLAQKYWNQLQAETKLPLFKKTGLLEIYNKNEIDIENALSLSKKYNFPLEVIDCKNLSKRFENFNFKNDFVGLYEQNSGFLDIELARQAFYKTQISKTNYIHTNEKVIDWQVVNNREVIVTTTKDRYKAKYLIIAPGAWYEIVKYKLTHKIKLIRKALCWFNIIQSENSHLQNNMPVFGFALNNAFYYGFPPYQGQIKIARHTGGDVIERPEDLSFNINFEEKSAIIKFAKQYIKNIEISKKNFAQCIYTLTDDSNFIIDKHPKFANVVIAVGLSGHGYKFAPIIADILIKLLLEEKIDFPIDFFSINRFE